MTIKEVSELYNITPDTLRYYESEGLIPRINRKNKIRNYQKQDCGWIEFIKCMRSVDMPIEVLRKYVSLFQAGTSTQQERKEILITQRNILKEKMLSIKETIKRLDNKIDHYDDNLFPIENQLNEIVSID